MMLIKSVIFLLVAKGVIGVDVNRKAGVRWDDGHTSIQSVHSADNVLPHVRIRRQKQTQIPVSPQMDQLNVPQERYIWQSSNRRLNDISMKWDDGSSHSASGRGWYFWPQVNRMSQLPQFSTNQHNGFYYPQYQNMYNVADWIQYPYFIQGPDASLKPTNNAFGSSPANVILMHYIPAMQPNIGNIAGLSSSTVSFQPGFPSQVQRIQNSAIGMMGIPSHSVIGKFQWPTLNNGHTFAHRNQFPSIEAGQIARFPVIHGNTFPQLPIGLTNSNINSPAVSAGKGGKPVDDK